MFQERQNIFAAASEHVPYFANVDFAVFPDMRQDLDTISS